MFKKHNFGAGPCILPTTVLEGAANAVLNWQDTGLSILEISHRSPEFSSVMMKIQLLVRDLLHIPDSYSVLFLQGGASTQFSMVPLNFLQGKKKASYLDTGYFAQKAIKEARLFGAVEIVASSADKNYAYVPDGYVCDPDSAYLHITSNNTIEGTEMFEFPKVSVPLICDMSSDIFSQKFNVMDFDLIYAGAQKNMGPAGVTLVIAKNSFLDTVTHPVPSMSDYRTYRDNLSMYNTPPVFSIYVALLNLLWLKEQGGIKAIEHTNLRKARMLYAEIDRNSLFTGLANLVHRSKMNVTFTARDKETELDFMQYAEKRGMVGIRGYRTAGGFRASLYNALPIESVTALVTLMQEYERSVLQNASDLLEMHV